MTLTLALLSALLVEFFTVACQCTSYPWIRPQLRSRSSFIVTNFFLGDPNMYLWFNIFLSVESHNNKCHLMNSVCVSPQENEYKNGGGHKKVGVWSTTSIVIRHRNRIWPMTAHLFPNLYSHIYTLPIQDQPEIPDLSLKNQKKFPFLANLSPVPPVYILCLHLSCCEASCFPSAAESAQHKDWLMPLGSSGLPLHILHSFYSIFFVNLHSSKILSHVCFCILS